MPLEFLKSGPTYTSLSDSSINSIKQIIQEQINSSTPMTTENDVEVFIFEETVDPPIMVLNPNRTHEEIIMENFEPNRGFLDWLLGIMGIGPFEGSSSQNLEPPTNCPTCTCGLAYKHQRIVGGSVTEVNGYPWMIAMNYNGRFYCGASLINNKYILTAAHCVNGFPKEKISATFLEHDRNNNYETQTISRMIKRVVRHSLYGSGGTYNNDIALLQLDEEVPFTGDVLRPACLPTIGKSFSGYTGVATGWGATSEHGAVSNLLQEVNVPIMSNADCRRSGYGYKITDNMMCAGYLEGGKDACQGDSGGPLHVLNGTQYSVVGVTSWGEGCAQKNYPGVYARVNRYITWIKSNTRDACYC